MDSADCISQEGWLFIDYQCLNAASWADAYPIPRVDDLIDCLGKAKADAYPLPRVDELTDRLSKDKYSTTLHLSRGY